MKIKKSYIIIASIVVFLVLIRFLVLPYVILHFANNTLASLNGYYGHIDDIGLSIYRGAYQIEDMYLNKVDSVSGKQTKFLKVKNIDLSVEWGALFHGKIVGKLYFDSPELIFTKNKTELGQVKKDTTDFRHVLNSFMPLTVNRFTIDNGSIHYVDRTSTPKVDVSLKRLHVVATNLTTVVNKEVTLPATVTASALVYGGTFDYRMKLDPLAKEPTFELTAELKHTNLADLNEFLLAYGKFDVQKGNFSLYTEMAAKGGKFKGYVKPIIKDLQVLGPKDKNKSFFHQVWEVIVGGVAMIFKNQSKNQVATKVPIEGSFQGPQVSVTTAIFELLRNAFIQALLPGIDNEITLKSVGKDQHLDKEGTLEKISDKNKNDNNKGDKKK